jgi:cytochrome c biogenesis protein CcmG, thiol:disulfide interchange protein DsbE
VSSNQPQRTGPAFGVGSLARLGIAALVIGVGLLALWQAGLLSESDGASGSGASVDLEPADASLQTPALAGRSVGLNVGDVAPDFEFSTFQGERLRLSDLRGRPVLLNFWASWCIPCRKEMPLMEHALREHEAHGLAVVAVNYGERIGPAQAFLERLEIDLQGFTFAYDPRQDVGQRYAILGLPVTYFVDAEGVITKVVPGELTEGILAPALRDAIAGIAALDK